MVVPTKEAFNVFDLKFLREKPTSIGKKDKPESGSEQMQRSVSSASLNYL
jgi:hypothetical protein